jgi:D-arabinose 1-dehydrogenase-like Zn-dependent alcohol dehydrogenase
LAVLVTYGIIYPVIAYTVKWIKAICHPITFPYKHVLITGCGTGLGKALVQEIYMKGAYITMIGRDAEKLQRVA